MNSTKERILEEALVCFAESGYKGTNLRDLASRLDLSKSALYRHFTSKEDIWNAVLDMMGDYYSEHIGNGENTSITPKNCEELYTMTMRMLDFTMHDKKVILTRQLLLTEQFRDERAKQLATFHFLTRTRAFYTRVFERMMECGILKKENAEMLALSYTAPITELIHLCDREPDKEKKVVEEIGSYVRHFISVYQEDNNG